MQPANLFDPAFCELSPDLLDYRPNFFPQPESQTYFEHLTHTIQWKQEELRIYGRVVKTPRLTAWYGDEGAAYTYSGVRFEGLPWTAELLEIKHKVETAFGVGFNSVLLNLYRDGRDSMGWHSDDEQELGLNPVIASVNFGQERRFDFRHKENHTLKHSVLLGDGSILLMKGDIQHHWQHQVAKTAKPIGARINLTFRNVLK
jgi:alkylated DNA repair dioxygenase AlkB